MSAADRDAERRAHLADGRAAADAARGGRAGARRHRAGGDGGRLQLAGVRGALLGAVLIQIGTNLANDYSDSRRAPTPRSGSGPCGSRGPGSRRRRGPRRGLWGVRAALLAGSTCRGRGLALLLVGVASIVAGVATPAARPFGYHGLGDVFVFLFFGVVAVAGTVFLQTSSSWMRSCSPCRSGCSPPRSWSSTTSATSRPTRAPASARWRSGSGRGDARAGLRYGRRRVPVGALSLRSARCPLAAAAAADVAARAAGRADGADMHRRSDAQRGARAIGPARARLRLPLSADVLLS